MNTNPHAQTILCFGDSNTYGQRADDINGRWPTDIRWTGQLQDLLEQDYYVIEEGLSGRTAHQAKDYLTPCLESHNPIDIVVLMLGTNDLKKEYNRSPQDICRAVRALILCIKKYARSPDRETRIILANPIGIDSSAPKFNFNIHDQTKINSTLKELSLLLEQLAKDEQCAFLDASLIAQPGEDGVHLSKDSHEKLAKSIYKLI